MEVLLQIVGGQALLLPHSHRKLKQLSTIPVFAVSARFGNTMQDQLSAGIRSLQLSVSKWPSYSNNFLLYPWLLLPFNKRPTSYFLLSLPCDTSLHRFRTYYFTFLISLCQYCYLEIQANSCSKKGKYYSLVQTHKPVLTY